MSRPRKNETGLTHVYTNLDIRHLAYAASYFSLQGDFKAIKSTSVLIRAIVEEWVESKGGNKLQSLDRAMEILMKLGIAPERKGRAKDRGSAGSLYEDEEEMDDREERELELDSLSAVVHVQFRPDIDEEELKRRIKIAEMTARATQFFNKATEEDLKKE